MNMMQTTLAYRPSSKLMVIAAFAAIYIIWGSTYIAIKGAISTMPALMMSGIRFTLAGGVLYFFSRMRGESTPPLVSVGRISLSGVLMLFVGTGSVAWAEQYIPSGLAAIIVASVPLWFVLFDRKGWAENFSNKRALTGLLVGFGGVLLLFADGKSLGLSGGDQMKWISCLVLVAGTISWAIGSLYSKYKPMEGSSGMKASIQMMTAGICSLLAGMVNGEHHTLQMPSTTSVLSLLYLIAFGSLVAYSAYVWLLSVRPPALVGTYAYVNPVVAVFLGWLFVGEKISTQQLTALAVILAGVILINFSKEKK